MKATSVLGVLATLLCATLAFPATAGPTPGGPHPMPPLDHDHRFGPGDFGDVLPVTQNAVACLGLTPDHSVNPTVRVQDRLLGGSVAFSVFSDWARVDDPTQPPCGDQLVETCDPTDPAETPGVTCNPLDVDAYFPAPPAGSALFNQGQVEFGPGQDGTYKVVVHKPRFWGTLSH